VSNPDIVIFGCGGHGRSVGDVVLSCDTAISLLFVDENAVEGEEILGFRVARSLIPPVKGYFVAIGDNRRRRMILESMEEQKIVNIVSGRSYVGYRSVLGRGVFVGHFSHVGPYASIGDGVIINTGAVVEHEVDIGRYTHIAPHATICGRSKIGELVTIGAAATVIDSISICSNVVVGAGTTVINDITTPGTYVGTPARRIG
jgi:sugar O-acyltransferase (sialic acid O-acetyltransferase NeuD family)